MIVAILRGLETAGPNVRFIVYPAIYPMCWGRQVVSNFPDKAGLREGQSPRVGWIGLGVRPKGIRAEIRHKKAVDVISHFPNLMNRIG